MSVRRALALLLTSIVLVVGCSRSTDPTTFTRKYTDHLNRVADTLQSVNGPADADRAAGEIKELTAETESLQKSAGKLSPDGDVPSDVQDAMQAAGKRVQDEIARLQQAGLVSPELERALSQLRSAHDVTLSYVKAGALTEAESPLEQAYVDYIITMENLADASKGVTDLASARASLSKFEDIGRRRNDALRRIAELGGHEPPHGVPSKYADRMRAAQKRAEQSDAALATRPDIEAIANLLHPAIAVDDEVQKTFRLSVDLRQAGPDNIVRVTLRNNQALQGPRHQLMTQMIKEAAGAQHAQAAIDDGTYRLVLSPVADMQAFIGRLNLGTVSEINPAERTFVLTVDPNQIPAMADDPMPGGPPGFGRPPGYGRPGGPPPAAETRSGILTDQDQTNIESQRFIFHNQEGRGNVVEIYLKASRPFVGPRMAKVLGIITRSTGARMLRPVRLQSGDMYFFFRSDKRVQELADALDLGPIETVDETGRKLVLTLQADKVPE